MLKRRGSHGQSHAGSACPTSAVTLGAVGVRLVGGDTGGTVQAGCRAGPCGRYPQLGGETAPAPRLRWLARGHCCCYSMMPPRWTKRNPFLGGHSKCTTDFLIEYLFLSPLKNSFFLIPQKKICRFFNFQKENFQELFCLRRRSLNKKKRGEVEGGALEHTALFILRDGANRAPSLSCFLQAPFLK